MDPAARKAIVEREDLAVSAEDLGQIRRDERRQRLRFAAISLIAGIGSFFLGAAVSDSVSPRSIYPFAAALPLLGTSNGNRRGRVLRLCLISGFAFVFGYLLINWHPYMTGPYYGVISR
jgi:hypothetical protein